METLEMRRYQTSTGTVYEITKKCWPAASAEPFWTWVDENGFGPSVSYASNRHATVEAVIEAVEREERYRQATAVPAQLDRAAYEAACERAGVAALSDAECDGYAVHYGQFSWPEYPEEVVIRMDLAKRRLRGIEAERAARPKAPRQPAPLVRCDCGHDVERGQVMVASLGTSCPECYDRMSA